MLKKRTLDQKKKKKKTTKKQKAKRNADEERWVLGSGALERE